MTASIYYICVDARDYRIVEMNAPAQAWHGLSQQEIDQRRPKLTDFRYPAHDRIIQSIDEVHRSGEPVDFSFNVQDDAVIGSGLWKVEFHPGPGNPDHVCWFAAGLNDVVDSVVSSLGSVPDDENT